MEDYQTAVSITTTTSTTTVTTTNLTSTTNNITVLKVDAALSSSDPGASRESYQLLLLMQLACRVFGKHLTLLFVMLLRWGSVWGRPACIAEKQRPCSWVSSDEWHDPHVT
jgi:hypothetical protein